MKPVPHPGTFIRRECLEPHAMTITAGAQALGVTRKAFSALVNGAAGISPEMAVRLSKAFGTPPELWLERQMEFELSRVDSKTLNVKPVRRTGANGTRP